MTPIERRSARSTCLRVFARRASFSSKERRFTNRPRPPAGRRQLTGADSHRATERSIHLPACLRETCVVQLQGAAVYKPPTTVGRAATADGDNSHRATERSIHLRVPPTRVSFSSKERRFTNRRRT